MGGPGTLDLPGPGRAQVQGILHLGFRQPHGPDRGRHYLDPGLDSGGSGAFWSQSLSDV